jgi:hypothetical protein
MNRSRSAKLHSKSTAARKCGTHAWRTVILLVDLRFATGESAKKAIADQSRSGLRSVGKLPLNQWSPHLLHPGMIRGLRPTRHRRMSPIAIVLDCARPYPRQDHNYGQRAMITARDHHDGAGTIRRPLPFQAVTYERTELGVFASRPFVENFTSKLHAANEFR